MPTNSSTSLEYRHVAVCLDYRVGNDGSVWSKKRGEWKKMKPTPQYKGHLMVSLRDFGKKHYRLVHRLVLEAFVGPCTQGHECRHLDGNPSNNKVENLAWGTHTENMRDRAVHGTNKGAKQGEQHSGAKLTNGDVLEIRSLFPSGRFTFSGLGRQFGVNCKTIKRIIKRERWKHI